MVVKCWSWMYKDVIGEISLLCDRRFIVSAITIKQVVMATNHSNLYMGNGGEGINSWNTGEH